MSTGRRWKGSAAGLSQQAGEAEGSRILEAQDEVGAALTTPGHAGTARQRGSGKRDGKLYARNQCLTPRNCPAGSNLADLGRVAAHATVRGGDSEAGVFETGGEATPKVCGVGVAMLPGYSWTAHLSTGRW